MDMNAPFSDDLKLAAEDLRKRIESARTEGEHGGCYIWSIPDQLLLGLIDAFQSAEKVREERDSQFRAAAGFCQDAANHLRLWTETKKERDQARAAGEAETELLIAARQENERLKALLKEAREDLSPTIGFRKNEHGEMRAVPGWIPLTTRIDAALTSSAEEE